MPSKVWIKDLPFPVKRMLVADGRAFVLAAPPPGMGSCRNLIALERSGRILWRVGPPVENDLPEPFVELELRGGGRIAARTASGRWFIIECSSGNLSPAPE